MRSRPSLLLLPLFLLASATPARAQTEATTCSGETPAPPETAAAAPPAAPGFDWRDALLAAMVLAVGATGIVYMRANERRRGAEAPAVERAPYLAGAGLGLLFATALVALHRPVGVSGGVQNLAGALGHIITPGTSYWGGVIPVGWTFSAQVVVGVFAGALLAAAATRSWRLRVIPEAGWVERFGPRPWRRWLLAFGAAALIEYAAAIAGGCTSGLAVSGGIALAPGAFVFMAAMFATGAPTALLLFPRGRS